MITSIAPSSPIAQRVTFLSEGETIAGNLFYPIDFQSHQCYPTIIVAGSWTTVKEQMAGLYAQQLARQGFITLAFDYRNFGESQGTPRFYESPPTKIKDLKSAVSFLETVTGVAPDQIGMLAVCASAGYMAQVTAEDSRVKALATVAAWLHDANSVQEIYGGATGVGQRIGAAQAAKQQYAQTGQVEYIPAISRTDPTAAMYGDFDYYLNPKRGAIPQWSADKFAVMSWEDWLTFDPMPMARMIQVPVLMVHADGAVLPDNVRRFYDQLAHPAKQLYWTEGTQFDFYDQPKQVGQAIEQATHFFQQQLPQE